MAFVMRRPVNVPSSHDATRSFGEEAARNAAPPAFVHGGVHVLQVPSEAICAPLTTVRSTCSSQPRLPENTSWIDGTGPAPGGITSGSSVQSSVSPTGDDQMRNAGCPELSTDTT